MSVACGDAEYVALIDPAFRCGILHIPLLYTSETLGLREGLRGGLRKYLSLCCLFQQGRCNHGERCYQVHVDRAFIAALRARQAGVVSCCLGCNDTASHLPAARAFLEARVHPDALVFVAPSESATRGNPLNRSQLAFTAGLARLLDGRDCAQSRAARRVVVVPAERVCRLHLRTRCKYAKDCKNVHVCSKLSEAVLELGPLSRPLPSPTPEQQPSLRPMPRFAPIQVAAPTQGESDDGTPLPTACMAHPADPVDACEGSGRLSGLCFDPARALCASRRTEALRFDFSGSEASWLAAVSPRQKREEAGRPGDEAGGAVDPAAADLRFFRLFA